VHDQYSTMRLKNSFESTELHFEFLTVLSGRPPQWQLENSKFEIESLESIFGTTYSMSRLLPTIHLAAVSKQSSSNARTMHMKQIVCWSSISRDVTELTELVQLSFGLIQLTNRPLASEEALEVVAPDLSSQGQGASFSLTLETRKSRALYLQWRLARF